MADLNAQPVDPRNAGWEIWDPAYQVHFWRRTGEGAWGSREVRVAAGDVGAATEWAERHASDGETYTLFAVVDHGQDRGLVRLAGNDPTRVGGA